MEVVMRKPSGLMKKPNPAHPCAHLHHAEPRLDQFPHTLFPDRVTPFVKVLFREWNGIGAGAEVGPAAAGSGRELA